MDLNIDYSGIKRIVFNFKLKLNTIPNIDVDILNCNGNRIYFSVDKLVAVFNKSNSTSGLVINSDPIITNTEYIIDAIYDFKNKTIDFTIDNKEFTVSEPEPEIPKIFNRFIGNTVLGNDNFDGEIYDFNVSVPGYVPLVPVSFNIADSVRIKGSSIPGIVKLNSNMLDNRSIITLSPQTGNSASVVSFNEIEIISTNTTVVGYSIKLFDYSRTDPIVINSDETVKDFIFTDNKYKFEQNTEKVLFKFDGHPNLIFSGELLDSYSSARTSAHTNYNTWMITVSKVSPEDTNSYNLDLNYNFVVTQYQNPVKVMSLSIGNSIVDSSAQINTVTVLANNADILSGGSYDLSHDTNTEELIFAPERIYGNTPVPRYKYKVEITKNNLISVEKKKLFSDFNASFTEKFRLSVYRVKKQIKPNTPQIYKRNNKILVNIPEKTRQSDKYHLANISTYVRSSDFTTVVYKTPVNFDEFVEVLFEKVDGFAYTCKKIASNLFKIVVFKISSSVADLINFTVLFKEKGKISEYTPIKRTKYNTINDTDNSVYNKEIQGNTSFFLLGDNKTTFIKYNTSNMNDTYIEQRHATYDYYYTKSAFYNITIYSVSTSDEYTKNKYVLNKQIPITEEKKWRHFENTKFITIPYYNETGYETTLEYFFYANEQLADYVSEKWIVIGKDSRYVFMKNTTLNNTYNGNKTTAFDSLISTNTVFIEDNVIGKYNVFDILYENNIIISLNNFNLIIADVSNCDLDNYEFAYFTNYYTTLGSNGLNYYTGSTKRVNNTNGITTPINLADYIQPTIVNETIKDRSITFELSEPFTGLVGFNNTMTVPFDFKKSEPFKSVKSLSRTHTNNDQKLLDFINNNAEIYVSMYSVPYPATQTTDYFALNKNLTNVSVSGTEISTTETASITQSKEIALETYVSNKPSYVFRLYDDTTTIKSTLNLSYTIPTTQLISENSVITAEYVGPIVDYTYNLAIPVNFTYTYAIVNNVIQIYIRKSDNTQWSNVSVWKITTYPPVEDYDTVFVGEL